MCGIAVTISEPIGGMPMQNHAVLNPVDHKDIKIVTQRSELYGDCVIATLAFPFEFRNVQSDYPILFQKDSNTGKFFPVALLGLKAKENLFLNEEGWDASYIPASILRQPFMVGFQGEKPIVTIDMDSPRVNKIKGEALFDEMGEGTDFLKKVTAMLNELHGAYQDTEVFIEQLLELELLESLALKLMLADGVEHELTGFYTINEDKLRELSADALGKLHNQNFLQPLFMAVASLSRLANLVDKKNKLLVC